MRILSASLNLWLALVLVGCSALSRNESPEGLIVEDLEVGEGREALRGDDVTVHYRGMLLDGTEFNSSYASDEPYSFPLGSYRVIAGWDEGIVGMREGGKRRLTIPHWLAYGRTGRGCDAEGERCAVPPLTPVVYEIELLAVTDRVSLD